jgi:hypothetical protein
MKISDRVPKCPKCQAQMDRWPYPGSFPKRTDPIWKKLSVVDRVYEYTLKGKRTVYETREVLNDGKPVPPWGPQGWDCHGPGPGKKRLTSYQREQQAKQRRARIKDQMRGRGGWSPKKR